ncbi:MAG: phage head closure protein [Pseudomonadota bacterium]
MTAPNDIGALRHRVTFEGNVPAAFDAEGGRAPTILKRIDTWAAIDLAGAQSSEETGQRISTITLDVTVRYRNDLTRDFKLHWRDSVYRIDAMTPADTHCQFLTLTCRAEI